MCPSLVLGLLGGFSFKDSFVLDRRPINPHAPSPKSSSPSDTEAQNIDFVRNDSNFSGYISVTYVDHIPKQMT
jgi:hypothetical protein